jgi:WD40 repeat protein
MSATQQSSVALRIFIVGELGFPSVTNASDSLAGLNTAELPDGAQAYVLGATRALYRLNKTSTVAGAAPAFIPAANGIGVWFFESGEGGNAFTFQGHGTAALEGATPSAVTQDTWIALPSGDSFYTTSSNGAVFAFNSTTGVVTYSGPANASYKVTAIATLACGTVSQSMDLAITQNGALITTTNFDGTAGAASADPTTASLGECIVTEKLITIASTGDTIQACMRNTSGTGTLVATHLSIVIEPA